MENSLNVKQIAVMTDFSEQARATYPYASKLATKLDSNLNLVHFAGLTPWIQEQDEMVESFNEALTNALKEEASGRFEGLPVATRLISGRWTPADLRTLENEVGVDMVIMATHSRTDFQRFIFGSFAERVIRNSVAPVFVCRHDEQHSPLEPKTIVVPYDFTETSRAVLPMVRLWSKHFGGQFHFLCVHEPPSSNMPFLLSLRERWMSPPYEKLDADFAELQKNELAGVQATLEILDGDPASLITDRCKQLNADLVLVGTHGVLGSVAQNVTHDVTCSVIVAPHPDSHRVA